VKVTVNGEPVPETRGNALVRVEGVPGGHALCDAEAARLRGLLAAERERFRRAQAEVKRLRALVARRERARGAEKLLTPAEAAGMLHVHQSTLKRWADAGKVTPAWTAGKHRRYREAEVREMLRAREDRRAPDA